jgi:hypothetical protein
MPSLAALDALAPASGAAAAPGPLIAAVTATPAAANPVATVFQVFVTTVLSFRRRLSALPRGRRQIVLRHRDGRPDPEAAGAHPPG